MSSFLAFQFPLGRIIIYAVKQISKPISRVAKNGAKSNPYFRKYVCVIPGQWYNKLDVRAKLLMLRMKQPKLVPPIPDAMAAEIGANVLGEVLLLALAGYLLYYEVSRQARKDQKKHDEHMQQRQHIQNEIDDLHQHIRDLKQQIEHIKETVFVG